MGDVAVKHLDVWQFRSYERAACDFGERLTVLFGPNGAGKTNLLEALYVACSGRSSRTRSERELVRFGAERARVRLETLGAGTSHVVNVVLTPGERKSVRVDGGSVEHVAAGEARPFVCVFMPDRMSLLKGPPALRRAHLDELTRALWPPRAEDRRAYARALSQRNALLAAIRSGRSGAESLPAWDTELALAALRLRAARQETTGALASPLADRGRELGLPGELSAQYRARSPEDDLDSFLAELRARRAQDLERGFCTYGPHRDELVLRHDSRALRSYGSQGEQRLALLALLLAERDLLTRERGSTPLMLLDDVLSELDEDRRARLVGELLTSGQSVVTTADSRQLPALGAADAAMLEIPGDVIATEMRAALSGRGRSASPLAPVISRSTA